MSVPVSDNACMTWSDNTPRSQPKVYMLEIRPLFRSLPDLLGRGSMLAIEKHALLAHAVKLADMLMGLEPWEAPDFILRDALIDGIFFLVADAEESAIKHQFERPGLSETELDGFAEDMIQLAVRLRAQFPHAGHELVFIRCDSQANLLMVSVQ